MGTENWTIAVSRAVLADLWGVIPTAAWAALDGVRFKTWNFPTAMPTREFDDAIGDADPVGSGHDSMIDINGPLGDIPLRYEGAERILAHVIGDDVGATSGAEFSHVMDPLLAHATGGFVGVAIDRGVATAPIIVHPSVRMTGVELKHVNGFLEATPAGVASGYDETTDPSLASVTQPTTALLIPFRDLVFRINAAGGAGLVAGDARKLTELSIKIENKEVHDFTTGNPAGGPEEPEGDGGHRDFTLSIKGHKHDLAWNAFETGMHPLLQAGSEIYKADAIWTGPTNGGSTRIVKFEFPNLVLTKIELPGEGARTRVRPSLEFRAIRALAQPTGMLFTVPYRCSVLGSDNDKDELTGVTIV